MYIQLSQQISTLTLQAAELVKEDKIQQCHELLVKRQALLEELMAQYQALPEPDLVFKKTFVDLINWLQGQDAVNNSNVIKLRELSKQTSVKQNKINKALHHYKSII